MDRQIFVIEIRLSKPTVKEGKALQPTEDQYIKSVYCSTHDVDQAEIIYDTLLSALSSVNILPQKMIKENLIEQWFKQKTTELPQRVLNLKDCKELSKKIIEEAIRKLPSKVEVMSMMTDNDVYLNAINDIRHKLVKMIDETSNLTKT